MHNVSTIMINDVFEKVCKLKSIERELISLLFVEKPNFQNIKVCVYKASH